jgi:hypothetical protein
VLKNGFLAQIYVFFEITVFTPADVHEPPEVAALAGVAKARIKKPAVKAAAIFLFNICLFNGAPSFNFYRT